MMQTTQPAKASLSAVIARIMTALVTIIARIPAWKENGNALFNGTALISLMHIALWEVTVVSMAAPMGPATK